MSPQQLKEAILHRIGALGSSTQTITQEDYDAAVELWNRRFNPVTIVNGEPSAVYNPAPAVGDADTPGFPFWERACLVAGVGGSYTPPGTMTVEELVYLCIMELIASQGVELSGQPIAQ